MGRIANLSLGLKCFLSCLFSSLIFQISALFLRPTSPSPPQSQHGPPQGQHSSPPPRVPAIPRPSSTRSLKQRDKEAMIAYIAILESEICSYQQQVGLVRAEMLTIEKEEVDPDEPEYRQELVKMSTALSDARIKEERFKRALAIQRKRQTNALNDMRAVNAETKVAYESKLAEAREMAESSQKKFEEAEQKLQKAESLHAEAKQFNDTASRTLKDVITRHDDLRSWFESDFAYETKVAYESKLAEARAVSQKKFEEAEQKLQKAESLHAEAKQFNDTASRSLEDVLIRHNDLRSWFESECERKENEIEIQRQSVFDDQKVLCQSQERLLEGQTLLRQNEEYVLERLEELSHFKKEMEAEKMKLEDEW